MKIKRVLFCTFLAAMGIAAGLTYTAEAEDKSPLRIEPRALNRMIENMENPMLINVAGYLSCMDARIPASVCMSCDDEKDQPDIFPDKKETKLVFYNVGTWWEPDCRIVKEAQRRGFTRIYVLKGGLSAWRRAGYDTESIQRIPRTPGFAIKPSDLSAWKKQVSNPLVLDIRSAEVFNRQHLEGAMNIPFSLLHLRYQDIPLERSLLVVDEEGANSFLAASYLARKGFSGTVRLAGGMLAWKAYAVKGSTK